MGRFSSLRIVIKTIQISYLIASKNAETIDDLFCCVSIGGFACHEIKEGIEVHIAWIVGINDGQDSLEIDVALSILSNRVSQRHKARFKLIRCQSARPILIKVIETAAEFIQLFLSDTLK